MGSLTKIPLASYEIGQGGPEQSRYDTDRGDSGGVVVHLRDGILIGWVAFHIELQQRIRAERLRLSSENPQNYEHVPVPGPKAMLQKGPGDRSALRDFRYTRNCQRLLFCGEIRCSGIARRVCKSARMKSVMSQMIFRNQYDLPGKSRNP
jgi:hypothetical protein